MLRTIVITTLALALSGCEAMGELAYDLRADEEAKRCESNMSMSDRQACLARVQAVEKKASEVRKARDNNR